MDYVIAILQVSGIVILCYLFFGTVCAVTTIIIMLLKKKVFNKSSANYQIKQAD